MVFGTISFLPVSSSSEHTLMMSPSCHGHCKNSTDKANKQAQVVRCTLVTYQQTLVKLCWVLHACNCIHLTLHLFKTKKKGTPEAFTGRSAHCNLK